MDGDTRCRSRLRFAVETDTNILASILGETVTHGLAVSGDIAQLLAFRIGILPLSKDILALPRFTAILGHDNHEIIVISHIVLRHGITGNGVR